ncbi:hypothetical protein [Patulibacter sp.]|uniref:hypothetical protein n=1 Tax=Patulibacter sp. TaxID=1912859 RepID=UPI00271D31B8|nr:hypothetical protein [Patulibacter sp.]MDO9406907.1 hypothetical protein [Patulibacter sp.]
MTRRLAVLPALLATLVLVPSSADAAPRGPSGGWGGGATAATVATIDTDDPTGGAGAAEVPDDVGAPTDAPGPTGTGPSAGGDPEGEGPVAAAPPVDPSVLVPVPSSRRTVRGRVARIRTDGRAAIPRSAPQRIKRVIAAANLIVGKPYKWGGGHSRLFDTGYDCSGAVGYALIRAGLQTGSMVSGTYARWELTGPGRWISIHANRGHVYMEVAGLRLDTSAVADPSGAKGVRWRPAIGRRTGFHTRHVKGL